MSLFTPQFDEKVRSLQRPEARASEMEHAIRHEIHVRLDDDPAFYTSLRERLEQIVADRKAHRIDAAEQLKLFEAVKRDLQGRAEAAERLGLSDTGLAIYGQLAAPPAGLKDPKAAEKAAVYGPGGWAHASGGEANPRRPPSPDPGSPMIMSGRSPPSLPGSFDRARCRAAVR